MPTVNEIWSGRSGPIEAGGSGNEGVTRRYTRIFRVIADNALQGPLTIRECTGIPRILDSYVGLNGESDEGALCHSVAPTQQEGSRIEWVVVCSFSSNPRDCGNKQLEQQENPLLQPTKVRTYFNRRVVPFRIDEDGNPVANSAMDEFDPPPESDDCPQVFEFTRNVPTFRPSFYATFRNTVNADKFLGFAPRQVRCLTIGASGPETRNGVDYFVETSSFEAVVPTFAEAIAHLNPLDLNLLDYGFHHLPGGVRTEITDGFGVAVASAKPLDGAGLLCAVGVKPAVLKFKRYAAVPYKPLGLKLPKGSI